MNATTPAADTAIIAILDNACAAMELARRTPAIDSLTLGAAMIKAREARNAGYALAEQGGVDWLAINELDLIWEEVSALAGCWKAA